MNTIDELIQHGIQPSNAKQMLSSYKSRIGTTSGVYIIKDINYDCATKSKDITLKCSLCGKEIHRRLNEKGKWSDLKKTCDCKKKEREKNLEKIKKEKIETMKRRIGEVFGDYEIVSLEDLDDKPKYTMRCCTCGSEKIISASAFSTRTDFHCTKHYVQPIKFDESYIGKKNNFLTVIGLTRDGEDNHRAFMCKCDCGNVKIVRPVEWEQGITKSCGCMHSKLCSENAKTHGLSKKRLYRVWNGMKQRCYNKSNNNYKNYGARGVTVCDEWKKDFTAFYDWAYKNGYDENAPKGKCTIDRIDVNGNYEPSNCRWADAKVQSSNRRPSDEWERREPKYELNGEKRTIASICEEYDVSDAFIRYRLNVLHMSLYDAVNTGKIAPGRPRKRGLA